MSAGLRVVGVDGLSVSVTIKNAAGSTTSAWSDAALTSPVTMPVVITTDTTFWLAGQSGVQVSMKVGGTELGPVPVQVREGSSVITVPVPSDTDALKRMEASDLATYGVTPGLLANRPTATGSRVLYFATDDGTGVLYQDTAAGVWSVLSRGGKLAHARNITGTVTSFSSASNNIDIPNTTLNVPACSLDVWLKAICTVQQTVLGSGLIAIAIYDITAGGGGTFVTNLIAPAPNSTGAGSSYRGLNADYYLGPQATARVFKLVASVIVDLAQTPSFAVNNNNIGGFPTEFLAEAR